MLHHKIFILSIYIPLCFYFIWTAKNTILQIILFTFHYASTLSNCQNSEELTLLNLHSTMLLLYLKLIDFNAVLLVYLHSTMLLLYQGGYGQSEEDGIYLHSTMLLLYRFFVPEHTFLPLHLHSTMLLLYLKNPFITQFVVFIYIPLCFYFIDLLNLFSSRISSHLHSTMLLLYRCSEACV